MNPQIKKLVDTVGTDVSGKWIAVEKVNLVILECVDNLLLNGYDDASAQLMKHFEVELVDNNTQ